MIHKYAENKVNCLLYLMLLDSGTSQSSAPFIPLSSPSGSFLSVSIKSSDSETSRPFKRSKMDDEASQSSLARDVSLSSNICLKLYLDFQYHLSDLGPVHTETI